MPKTPMLPRSLGPLIMGSCDSFGEDVYRAVSLGLRRTTSMKWVSFAYDDQEQFEQGRLHSMYIQACLVRHRVTRLELFVYYLVYTFTVEA